MVITAEGIIAKLTVTSSGIRIILQEDDRHFWIGPTHKINPEESDVIRIRAIYNSMLALALTAAVKRLSVKIQGIAGELPKYWVHQIDVNWD